MNHRVNQLDGTFKWCADCGAISSNGIDWEYPQNLAEIRHAVLDFEDAKGTIHLDILIKFFDDIVRRVHDERSTSDDEANNKGPDSETGSVS